MKNHQKGFVTALLLIVIGVLVISGGIYIYTQNKNNQKTIAIPENHPINTVSKVKNSDSHDLSYTSSTLGLSFKYSSDLEVRDSKEYLMILKKGAKNISEGIIYIHTDTKSVDQLISEAESSGYKTDKTNVSVNGINMVRLSTITPVSKTDPEKYPEMLVFAYYFQKNNISYIVQSNVAKIDTVFAQEAEDVISTIHFN